jgi:hypothetical protein
MIDQRSLERKSQARTILLFCGQLLSGIDNAVKPLGCCPTAKTALVEKMSISYPKK